MSGARRFDLVLFDLDGTLVDSAPDIAWSLNTTLAEAGLAPLALPTVKQFVGDGAGKLIERALAASPAGTATGGGGADRDPARLLGRFVELYGGHVAVGTRPYPGVPDLLAALGAHGVQAAVITNKPHHLAVDLLASLRLSNFLAAVVGDGDGFPKKPDPTAARDVLARLQVSAARAVVVGDGLPDLRLARAIPCFSVAAAWGYLPATTLAAEAPDLVAASIVELAAFLMPA